MSVVSGANGGAVAVEFWANALPAIAAEAAKIKAANFFIFSSSFRGDFRSNNCATWHAWTHYFYFIQSRLFRIMKQSSSISHFATVDELA
jgi:hypothetical protein